MLRWTASSHAVKSRLQIVQVRCPKTPKYCIQRVELVKRVSLRPSFGWL
jgi:hypothetical protein